VRRIGDSLVVPVAGQYRLYQSVLTALLIGLCLSAHTVAFASTRVAAAVNSSSSLDAPVQAANAIEQQCVVVVHGLARTSRAMKPLARAFEQAGYTVVNVDYPSRQHPVEYLAPLAIEELGISQCGERETVHFVTHSLGGILVRYYLAHNEIPADLPELGRVVMLAPPNKGSEVVDNYKKLPGFYFLNGPAGMQLGTDEQSIPSQLPAVNFDLGVIAGSRTFNPILSFFLPNPDDGKVSAESARVDGMRDYLLLPVTHTFLMRSQEVIEQAIHYIQHGRFRRDSDNR
jgi:pimeloyl-ACP methyl ester carboxylesterase